MITNITTMTTPSYQGIASGFGMPTCGQTAFATLVTSPRCLNLPSVIVRDRAAAKGQLGLVATVPGTNAWSPPLC